MRIDEFLLARIAEDEAVAHRARGLLGVETPWYDAATLHDVRGFTRADAAHVEAWSPARVLAECAAKRAVVEAYQDWPVLITTHPRFEQAGDLGSLTYRMAQEVAWATNREYVARFGADPPTAPHIRALAAVYADHPDYRAEWKVGA